MGSRLRWLTRWHNIKIAPVVIFIRLPIMIVGMALYKTGEVICKIGDRLPGWSEYP